MSFRSHTRFFALLLCVLAQLVTQSLGNKAGYLCLCGGRPVATQTSHCHGPHGDRCHSDDAKVAAPHSEDSSSSREDHLAVKLDVAARPAAAAWQVAAPALALTLLPQFEILCPSPLQLLPAGDPMDFAESPPSGVRVARTIVLLV